MIRFRINELIAECNELIAEYNEANPNAMLPRLHMQSVAEAVGAARSTLANLTTLNREPVTNTALVESLCRYFSVHHPDFELSMLFEFTPELTDSTTTHIDELYPERAARSGRRTSNE